MATTTEHRPLPRAEAGLDRSVEITSRKPTSVQPQDQGNLYIWAFLIAALVVLGAGYYYYTSYYSAPVVTPAITETVAPPEPKVPDAVTPPVVAPKTVTPPVVTQDPPAAAKTTP